MSPVIVWCILSGKLWIQDKNFFFFVLCVFLWLYSLSCKCKHSCSFGNYSKTKSNMYNRQIAKVIYVLHYNCVFFKFLFKCRNIRMYCFSRHLCQIRLLQKLSVNLLIIFILIFLVCDVPQGEFLCVFCTVSSHACYSAFKKQNVFQSSMFQILIKLNTINMT